MPLFVELFAIRLTEIIYNIAISFILGFDDGLDVLKHNFRQANELPYVKEGRLEELPEELYGEG